MATRFDGQIGAFAYLLAVLLYMPCVSAIAANYRETGPRWRCSRCCGPRASAMAEVRNYLAKRGRAPVSDIAARFQVDVSAVHAILDHLIRKGRARLVETPTGKCGGCCGCADKLPEIYEWLDTHRPR